MQHLTKTGSHHVRRLIDAASCVSFDLFDTLVRRKGLFFPKDLFQIVESAAIRKIGPDALGYAGKREEAESAARAKAWPSGRMETDLVSIYAELERRMPLPGNKISELATIELDCEREVLERDPSGSELYDYAISSGKAVFITTDTYFDESFIVEICERFGFGKARLFVSSTWGKVKHDGSLFRLLVGKTGLQAEQILHIGDNPLSDITAPSSAGIKTWHYVGDKRRYQLRKSFSGDKSGSAAVSKILCDIAGAPTGEGRKDTETAQGIGKNLAFLLLGFTSWLHHQLRTLKPRRVYFIAREGLILKRCFDEFSRLRGGEFETRYLVASRASLYPSLIFSDRTQAIEMFSHVWGKATLATAVERMSLRIEEALPTLRRHGFHHADERLTPATHERFRAYLSESWKAIEDANRQKNDNIVSYLEQELFLEPDDAVLIDTGWHLTLQRCLGALSHARSVRRNLQGRYLGTFAEGGHDLRGDAAGFLATRGEPRFMAKLLKSSPPLIELLHGASHGTVLEYAPIRGKVEPVFEQNSVESRQYAEIVAPIQSIALDYFDTWNAAVSSDKQFAITPELCAGVGLRMISHPTLEEASFLGGLKQAQDFRGSMKSITGIAEWDLGRLSGDLLPDGTIPMWKPGFDVLSAVHTLKTVLAARTSA